MKIAGSFLQIQDNKEKIRKLNDACDYIHFDVMDGTFTENMTAPFEKIYPKVKSLNKIYDIHLMVNDIKHYVDIFEIMRPKIITFHYEAATNIDECINYIKQANIKVGIALNPDTDIKLLNKYLSKIDLVLVMSVPAGAGGQKFIDISSKIKYLIDYRKKHNLKFLIEVDGGINDETICKVIGSDIVVVGSYITSSDNYKNTIKNLKNKIGYNNKQFYVVVILMILIIFLILFSLKVML